MKKKNWTIGLWVLFAKSIVDIIVLNYISSHTDYTDGDMAPVSDYIDRSIGIGFLLTLIVVIGTGIVMLKAIKRASADMHYHFEFAKIFAFLEAALLFFKGVMYDHKRVDEKLILDEINHVEKQGHGIPVYTFLFMAFAFGTLILIFALGDAAKKQYTKC